MKLWNKNICLTNRLCVLLLAGVLFSTLVLASVWPNDVIEEIKETPPSPDTTIINTTWIPTEEDIAYQDSMYQIIKNTQNDVTDIKEDIVLIIERLDYVDGTHDSVRYVKGGKIDKERN